VQSSVLSVTNSAVTGGITNNNCTVHCVWYDQSISENSLRTAQLRLQTPKLNKTYNFPYRRDTSRNDVRVSASVRLLSVGCNFCSNRRSILDRLRLKCDGTRAETRFRLSAKRRSPFKWAGPQFIRLLAVEV